MANRATTPGPGLKIVALVILAASIAIPLSWMVDRMGANIPAVDLLPGHIQAVVVGCLLSLTIPFWPGDPWEKRTLLATWVLKLAVVLVAMLFYESAYPTLDAYSFYAGYSLSPDSIPLDPVYGFSPGDGTGNVTSLVQILKQVLGASYHSIKVLFAFAGLGACYVAYCAGVKFVGRKSLIWLLLLLATPSMLFWTGILGKDPIVVLGISTFLLGAAKYAKDGNSSAAWTILLGLFVASSMRLWLLPILMIPLTYLFAKTGPSRVRVPLAGFATLAMVGGAIALAVARGVTSPSDLLPALAQVSQQWAEGGSAQRIEVPFDSIAGLAAFLPLGAFTALFRPLPMEVPNAFGLLAGIENLALLAFGGYIVLRKGLTPLQSRAVVFLMICLASWALVYALISFQNLGTASRFKVQALPILLLLYWVALAKPERKDCAKV
ncbi:MAG: hypothetical protein H7Y17_02850 [Chlorobia bacterium]|nr:hypothetical protein [Fimbriimonadaceae bacterium]